MRNLLIALFLLVGTARAQNWMQVADFPGSARDDAAGFVIGNNFYVGTGLNSGFNPERDFYIMDLTTTSWTTGVSLPAGMERQYASGFNEGNYGYIFGGVGPGNNYLNDLWRFDATTMTWQSLTPLPAAGRKGAAVFVIGGDVFICGGNNATQPALRENWKYNIAGNSWQQLTDFPFPALWRSAGCAFNGNGYLNGGIDSTGQYSNFIYKYNPGNDTWSILTQFPGNGFAYTQMFPYNNSLLFYGGIENGNVFLNYLWRFDFSLFAFVPASGIPTLGRKGYVACLQNNVFYITTGLVSTPARTTESWKCFNITGTNEPSFHQSAIYPNPFNDFLYLPFAGQLEIQDLLGRVLLREQINSGIYPLNQIPNGSYLLKLRSKEKTIIKQIIKQ